MHRRTVLSTKKKNGKSKRSGGKEKEGNNSSHAAKVDQLFACMMQSSRGPKKPPVEVDEDHGLNHACLALSKCNASDQLVRSRAIRVTSQTSRANSSFFPPAHFLQKKPLRFKKKCYHHVVPLIKLHQGACNYKHQTPTSP